ncbi:DUF742 domain-containing protein [Streptomyces sp. TRM68367]|uniref:DUF742 domain-containing protein n=1 Tax=Streptomyces sp. TRM68367 TaxID=2758415 RepID=UPI00165CDEE4|nr:DUF742 domain-containing protein [Streptomyces sp. TRM68367]MBC9725889.1 DUF742 domain-containing protein [Streptomyces sp. TRM68367]
MIPPQRQRRHPQQEPPPEPATSEEGPPEKNPERLYVVAGPNGERITIDLVTLIKARADPPRSATPEQAALLRLCVAPMSVAELSAYLSLPFSSVTVLITEMLMAELVTARNPIVRQTLPDRSLLETVMHGLQRL